MATIDNAFRVEILSIDDVVLIGQGSGDPSTGAGFNAPVGSLYLRTNGQVWQKVNLADVDWTQLAAGAGVVNINDLGDVTVTTPTTGQVLVYNSVSGNWENVDGPGSIYNITKEPTGFPNRDDSQISFNEGNRTFTIAPIGASFDYYIWGVKYTVSAPIGIVIPNIQGMHYLYLNNVGAGQVQTGGFIPTLLTDYAYCGNVYWDVATQTAAVVGDERHGLTMDAATHMHFHLSLGTQYISGLSLNAVSVGGTGDLASDAQFGVDNGVLRDEDIQLDIVHSATGPNVLTANLEQILNAPAQIPVLYRTGATGNWLTKTADTYPLIYSGTAGYVDPTNQLPAWNEWTGTIWQLTPVPNNHYLLIHIIATNDIRHPIVALQGILEYQNKPRGQEAAAAELNVMSGLPFQEFRPIATVIYQCKNTFTNVPKAALVADADGNAYVDWRTIDTFRSAFAGGGITDHGNLGGLADDDHLQYALAGSGSTRTFDLGDLTNVTITTPATGQSLIYNTGTWVNGITGAQTEVDNIEAASGGIFDTSGNFDPAAFGPLGSYGDFTYINDGTVVDLLDSLYQLDQALLAVSAGADSKVAISATDTTSDYLNNELLVGSGLTKAIDNLGANETLTISIVQANVVGNPSPANDQSMFVLPDASRAGKLLTVETNLYHFTETVISPLEWIQIGVAADAATGIIMPFNGTVIRAVGQCINTGGSTKSIDLYIDAVNTTTVGTFTGAGEQTFSNTTLNVDFAAGQKLRLRGGAETGNIDDSIITLYIKWRA